MSKPWGDYRDAFDQFARKVRYLQNLASQEKIDHGEIELALLAVEQARLEYNARRDVLARELLRRSAGEVPTKIDLGGSDRERVKAIAELFWELTGKPEGSADDNWHRAESIVRRTSAVRACC